MSTAEGRWRAARAGTRVVAAKTRIAKWDQRSEWLGRSGGWVKDTSERRPVAKPSSRVKRQACIIQNRPARITAKVLAWVTQTTRIVVLNCGVGLPYTVAVSCIELPTAEQAPHYTLLCLIERQLVNHRDTRYVREINSGRATLRPVGIEGILRVRDSIAAADGA